MEVFPYLREAISRVLTSLREDAGLSKRKLSMLSSIDRVYIRQVEQGKYQPTVNFIFLLAQSLGIAPSASYGCIRVIVLSWAISGLSSISRSCKLNTTFHRGKWVPVSTKNKKPYCIAAKANPTN